MVYGEDMTETTPNADSVRVTTDRFGRQWRLLPAELCPTCGQPDNCGDCSHDPLSELQAKELGALNSVEDQALRRALIDGSGAAQ